MMHRSSSPASAVEKTSSFTRSNGLRKPCATDRIKIIDENGRCLTSSDRTLIPEDLDMSKEANQKALAKLLSHEVKAGAKFSGGERMSWLPALRSNILMSKSSPKDRLISCFRQERHAAHSVRRTCFQSGSRERASALPRDFCFEEEEDDSLHQSSVCSF